MIEDLEEISRLIPLARKIAQGSADPLFDVIEDAEALLAGRRTLGDVTADQVRGWLAERVNRGY